MIRNSFHDLVFETHSNLGVEIARKISRCNDDRRWKLPGLCDENRLLSQCYLADQRERERARVHAKRGERESFLHPGPQLTTCQRDEQPQLVRQRFYYQLSAHFWFAIPKNVLIHQGH